MHGVAALLRSAAYHKPWLVVAGIELALVALRAFAAAHVLGTGTVFQAVIGFKALQNVMTQIVSHGYFTALRLRPRL
ncbi:hypothetical protein D9M71_832750 [compost metagenome]